MATGLGGEQLWLSPTVANNVNPFDDQSGNGNNGTATGTTVVADTSAGGTYAFDFNGTSDYIACTLGTALGSDMSFSCWIKFDNAASSTETFVSNDGYATGGWLLQRKSTGQLRYAENADPLTFNDNTWSSSTTWCHVASVRVGGVLSQYINGVLLPIGVTGLTAAITKTAFVLGRRQDSLSQYSDCKMDDIRAYDRALTQAEITHLASQRGVEGPPPVGLGTEKAWLCPSLNDSADDISGTGTYAYSGGLTTTSNTGEGGTLAYDYDQSAAKAILQDASEVIDDTDSFSVSWWMNPSTLASSTNYYIADCRSRTGGSYNGWSLVLKNNSGALNLGSGIYRGSRESSLNSLEIDASASARLNVWTHCTVNWDNATNTWTLFVDGVNTDTHAASVTGGSAVATGTHLAVGNYSPAPASIYSPVMLMDDFRVHNRVLTQAEITHLATSRGVLGPPGGAANYSPFRNAKYINKTYQIPRFG